MIPSPSGCQGKRWTMEFMEKFLLETNNKPENTPLEKEIPDLGKSSFFGAILLRIYIYNIIYICIYIYITWIIMDFSSTSRPFLKKARILFWQKLCKQIGGDPLSGTFFRWFWLVKHGGVFSVERLPTKKVNHQGGSVGSFYVNQYQAGEFVGYMLNRIT